MCDDQRIENVTIHTSVSSATEILAFFFFPFCGFFFFALGVSFLLVEASSDGGEQIKSCLRSDMKA